MRWKINKGVVYTLFSFTIIVLGTLLAIEYAKGRYRLSLDGVVQGTGLLSTNSSPTGAEVFVNDRLVTATDDTLYLEPGVYQVELIKDGYAPWRKAVEIQPELVTQTNARLFPIAPSLSALTFSGAENPLPSPDGQKILYYTASQSAERRNGLYVMELSNNLPITLQRGPRQIAEDIPEYDLANAHYIWSPDSGEIIILSEAKEMLLSTDRLNDLQTMSDIRFQKRQILAEWEYEMYVRERQFLAEFPVEILKIATESARNVYVSPDKKRLLYTATASAVLPEGIVPPLPASSTQVEERLLEPGSIYIYDREEDRNFKVATEPEGSQSTAKWLLAKDLHSPTPMPYEDNMTMFETLQATESGKTARNFNRYHISFLAETLQWYPDSRHLLFVQDSTIKIMEYDATNIITLYTGPFNNNFHYPWPDGNRLVISTQFSPNAPDNLYAIELR
ncbi:MAG: PEGA domain-containing protein [Patescibacteria group bacterium]